VKAVPDTMMWVSYTTRKNGYRYRLIEQARRQRVRFFVSEYILQELTAVLVEDLGLSRRYAQLARRAVLRIAKLVALPSHIGHFISGDPGDDPVLQTSLSAKADYLITADRELLSVRKVRDVEIITAEAFGEKLDANE
jgi:putative PIN family toxin of toxin-antitoxin system